MFLHFNQTMLYLGLMQSFKMRPKWVPDRIIDAAGVRKPLDRYLGRYDSALEGILAAPGRILAAIYRPCGATSWIRTLQAGPWGTKIGGRHPPYLRCT